MGTQALITREQPLENVGFFMFIWMNKQKRAGLHGNTVVSMPVNVAIKEIKSESALLSLQRSTTKLHFQYRPSKNNINNN